MATRRCKGRVFGGSIKASLQAYQTSAALAAGTNSITLNMWVRISPESYAEVATHELAGYADVLYATTGWLVSQYSYAIYLYHQNGGAPILAGVLPPSVVDRWVMLTFVVDTGTGRGSIYLNGAQLVAPTVMAWNVSANSTFNIGANGFGGMTGQSRIGRVTYWQGTALTAAQIATLYYDGVEPGTPLLIFDATPTVATTTPNTGSLGGNFTTNSAQWWYPDVPLPVRQSRQNKLTYANDLSNAAWTKYQCSAAVSATPHPTRTGASVWRVTENNAVGDAHGVVHSQTSPSTTGARRAVVKAKAGSVGRGIGLGVNGGAAAVYADLSTGAINPVGAAITRSGIRSLGNGWWEILIEYVDTGGNIVLYMTSGGVTVYNGDGTSYIELCDATVHEIPRPSEYIDTTAYVIEYGAASTEKPLENILPYSNTLTSWTNVNATIAANGSAWDVTDDSAVAYEYITDTTTASSLTIGKRYCFSMFVKKTVGATSGPAVNITMGPYTAGIRINPNSGVVTTSSSPEVESSVGSEAVKIGADDYWFIWSLFTAQASATTVYFYPAACALSGDAIGSDSSARTGTTTVYAMSLTRGGTPPADHLATTLAGGWISSPAPRGKAPRQNLLSYANDMTNAVWAAQAGVIVTSGATAPDGTATAFNVDLTAAAVATGIYQIVGLASGTQQGTMTTRSVWVKGASGTISFTDPASGNEIVTATMDGTWQKLSITEVCSQYGAGIWVRKGTATTIQLWHPSLNRTDGDSEFLASIYKYASDAVRTGRGKRTQNLAIASQTPATIWSNSQASLSAPSAGVCRVTDNAVNDEHIAYTSSTASAWQSDVSNPIGYSTITVLAKAGTKSWMRLRAGSAAAEYAYFDLTNGAVGNTGTSVVRTSIASEGNGWYRCSMTYWSYRTSPTTDYCVVGVTNGNGAATYAGDGTGYIDFKEPNWSNTTTPVTYVPTNATYAINRGTPRSAIQA